MNKKLVKINVFFYFFIFFFSFGINYFYANLGVFPIDTFAFFDTAYNILLRSDDIARSSPAPVKRHEGAHHIRNVRISF